MCRPTLLSYLTLVLVSILSLVSSSAPSSSHRHAREGIAPSAPAPLGPFPWFNYSLPLDDRAHSLVSSLTVKEKLSLMSNKQPAIARLGLPYYDWESEGSHGVARAGRATVFPSPIMMASTFSTDISYRAGRVVSMEGRGKFNDYINKHGGNNTRWYSLDFLAPNINLFLHEGGLLPIDLTSTSLKRIAVVGPNADRLYTLLGNYDGCTDGDGQNPPIDKGCVLITPLAAIQEAVNATNSNPVRAAAPLSLTFAHGVDINSTVRSGFDAAVKTVRGADVAIVVMGITTCSGGFGNTPQDCIEGEMLDRKTMELSGLQPEFMRLLIATGTPLVLVTMSGSPLALNEWHLASNVLAIVQHWYSGEEGGHGLTDLLFGEYAPSGRLPVSWPLDDTQIPEESNYSMTAAPGRSYRYTTAIPAYSFGFGLSYTSWQYSLVDASTPLLTPAHFSPNPPADAAITIRFKLANTGGYSGMETVQVYSSYSPLTALAAVQSIPRTELKAFTKVEGGAGQAQQVTIQLNVSALALVGPDGSMGVQAGVYLIHVGGAAPGSRGMLIDGEEQHSRIVREKRPQQVLSVGACQDAKQWWADRTDSEDGMAAIEVEQAIAGGLVGVLTIC